MMQSPTAVILILLGVGDFGITLSKSMHLFSIWVNQGACLHATPDIGQIWVPPNLLTIIPR